MALTGRQALAKPSGALSFGPAQAFSFRTLVELVRERARGTYVPALASASEVLDKLDYDELGKVAYPLAKALYRDLDYPVTFFHLGAFFRRPVQIFEFRRGVAREIIYHEDLFSYPPDSPPKDIPEGAGFAGFRLHDAHLPASTRQAGDWLAFLGASYFRSAGDAGQYGISARGLALNTANPEPPHTEEFPDFTRFYISPPAKGVIEILALLEGESVTGAYRFLVRKRPSITMDVECELVLRRDVARLGIAPATSMYYYSETYRTQGTDYRPKVHDSDGLALWAGRFRRAIMASAEQSGSNHGELVHGQDSEGLRPPAA